MGKWSQPIVRHSPPSQKPNNPCRNSFPASMYDEPSGVARNVTQAVPSCIAIDNHSMST
jgi:hypothetical protein